MEIFDLTLKDIVDKQIVLVEFTPNNILSFLVGDEECPCVPGYPACSLTRFTSLKLGRLPSRKHIDDYSIFHDFILKQQYGNNGGKNGKV